MPLKKNGRSSCLVKRSKRGFHSLHGLDGTGFAAKGFCRALKVLFAELSVPGIRSQDDPAKRASQHTPRPGFRKKPEGFIAGTDRSGGKDWRMTLRWKFRIAVAVV